MCASNIDILKTIYENKRVVLVLGSLEIVSERLLLKQEMNEKAVLIVSWLTCIVVSILFLTVCSYIKECGKVIAFLGKISYELYLSHVIVILFLHNSKWTVSPDILLICITIFISIIGASVWNKANK